MSGRRRCALRELLGDLYDGPVPDLFVSGIADDSRSVVPGDLFVAVRGASADGHGYVQQAIASGAVAVLSERALVNATVPVVTLPDLASMRAALAARFFGHPSRALVCTGVTGTNGKTSVAHFVCDVADRLGKRSGYLGTLGFGRIGRLRDAGLTTMGAIALQRTLADLVGARCDWAVLEVSSHALAQQRVDGVDFDVAVFTNLSRDHLDYHGDEARYARAKMRLFSEVGCRYAVVNGDDPVGRRILSTLDPRVARLTFGTEAADIRWSDLRLGASGIEGVWHTPWGEFDFQLPLYGKFSVANAAAALGVLCSQGLATADVVDALAHVRQVPGRMEFFRFPERPTVVVDYAHTPDALSNALRAIADHCVGRIHCVFGCGGDRDRGKRPEMGALAERGADVVWITSDNPRSEDPQRIVQEIRAGMSSGARCHTVLERREAIEAAIAHARVDDVVLVAGKGHETYQDIAGQRLPFSDRETVRDLLAEAA